MRTPAFTANESSSSGSARSGVTAPPARPFNGPGVGDRMAQSGGYLPCVSARAEPAPASEPSVSADVDLDTTKDGATNIMMIPDSGPASRLAGFAFALAVLCAPGAHAQTPSDDGARDWYMSLTGFHVMPRDSDTSRPSEFGRVTGDAQYGGSPAFAAAVGTHVMENVRVELEVGYSPVDIEGMTNLRVDGRVIDLPYGLTGESDVWTVTLGASYDFPTAGPVRPYVGAGIGIAHHDTNTTFTFAGVEPTTQSGDDTVVSYHLRAGIGYELSDTVVLYGGYRYIGAQDVEIAGTRSTSATDALEAGLRIRF